MMLSGKSQRLRETLALLFIQDKLPAHRRGPLAVIYSILLSRSFEISRRRTWPFHIPNAETTVTGRKTNRVTGAQSGSLSNGRYNRVSGWQRQLESSEKSNVWWHLS